MFPHAVCVNLSRRPERWRQFRDGANAALKSDVVGAVQRYPAVDSRRSKPPAWFSAVCRHPGAWGCLRTHHRIWEDALSAQWESVLVFEDDAIFCDHFAEKLAVFLANVPDDWEQIYLGGQHLYEDPQKASPNSTLAKPPSRVNEHVLRCQNVNRTHAYAIRPSMMQAASDACALLPQGIPTAAAYHVDHRLGELCRDHKVYSPTEWLVGQEHGVSDVIGNRQDRRRKWWNEFQVSEPIEAEAAA